MPKKKIGVFTIASKNYISYVRVLLNSIRDTHPEYKRYFCLADRVDNFTVTDPECFEIVQADQLDIPSFNDMVLRYDIMELNTAVKPFMFQWLLNNTDLDSIIYLDPDIRAYSHFDQLETVLESGASVVLTPHITEPLEDGKSPNDYHMLQAGVFNLGFAAINRCAEAQKYVQWWGRRLETQANVDLQRNLFTDQRWCDLAPCLLDGLHVLKNAGYNAAYWNLAERSIYLEDGQWKANSEPLAFFHFSGINVREDTVVSKHQDRFSWDDLRSCKPLFDNYRRALLEQDWEATRNWPYAYAQTPEGLPIPTVVRHLYRQTFQRPKPLDARKVSSTLLELCNGLSNGIASDSVAPITRLMEVIYRARPDLQSAFSLNTHAGRVSFRDWYLSAAQREYGLTLDFVPTGVAREAAADAENLTPAPRLRVTTEGNAGNRNESSSNSIDDCVRSIALSWQSLPPVFKQVMAPMLRQVLKEKRTETSDISSAPQNLSIEASKTIPASKKIISLLTPSVTVPVIEDGRPISTLMQIIWLSRPDLQQAFDLTKAEGQRAFANWFESSAEREYGLTGTAEGRNFYRSPVQSVPGANLIGYAHAEVGMGEHVRMSAAALETTKVEFGVVDFNVGITSRQEATLDHGREVRGNPYSANLFHINADQMLVAYCHLGHRFFLNRYNIGFWAWELAKCPPQFFGAVQFVDEIWAPSRFIQKAFAESVDVPVEYMPLCVELPPFRKLDRRFFGIRDNVFVFLFTFDFLSFVDRKNPLALIRAFHLAFPNRASAVCLVLKVMNGLPNSAQWITMMSLIDQDPRILIINRTLNRSEILALFDACDCFASLHRSEGFGRGPAEAMYLGKPVIVTNYSGNTDFTTSSNSCLVDFSLVPVQKGQYTFFEGQQWADADVEHAAWYMSKMQSDPSYAREMGARGQDFIRAHFNHNAIGALYEARLAKLHLL